MTLKLLGAAAFALSLAAFPAVAQDTGTGTGTGADNIQGGAPGLEVDQGRTASTGNSAWTDAERSFYGENDLWTNFYTDSSMTTLRSEAEIRETFAAMGADDQAGMKAACDRVNQDRGSYGTVTAGLCAQIGEL